MRQVTAYDKYEPLPTGHQSHSPGKIAIPLAVEGLYSFVGKQIYCGLLFE